MTQRQHPPLPPPGVVHAWAIERDASADMDDLRCELSSDELIRAAKLRLPDRRDGFVFSRAWVRRILASYASIPPHEVPLATTPSGKPAWVRPAGGVQLAFSVSHRQDLTLVAVTAADAVGTDLEVLEEHAKYDAIARMALCPKEWAEYEMLAADERPAAVLRAWTRKEAVLKALGVGLGRPASSLEVTFLVDQPPLLLASEGVPCQWPLASWSPRPGWFAAVAVPHFEAEPRIEHFSATMLRDRYPSPAPLAAPLADGS